MNATKDDDAITIDMILDALTVKTRLGNYVLRSPVLGLFTSIIEMQVAHCERVIAEQTVKYDQTKSYRNHTILVEHKHSAQYLRDMVDRLAGEFDGQTLRQKMAVIFVSLLTQEVSNATIHPRTIAPHGNGVTDRRESGRGSKTGNRKKGRKNLPTNNGDTSS